MNISVFGSGGWGTAVALLLAGNGHTVTIWSNFASEAEELRRTRRNPLLPGVVIPENIVITSELNDALSGVKVAVIATPSFAVRETAERLRGKLPEDCIIVCISKGIEKETSSIFSAILSGIFGDDAQIAYLSGPSHAEEVSRKIPTACVAASDRPDVAQVVQDLFMNDYFRVYTSSDVIGVELGAALKNVIALCAGVSEGLGFGDNTMAMLATRGLAEIAELVVALGGKKGTVAGLAGLGDLIVTCTSRHSRNRRAGVLIGKGTPVMDAMREVGAVVEGYYAAKAAVQLAAKAGVDMPICTEAYAVLYEGKSAMDGMRKLMSREKRSELDFADEAWVNS